jgi:hypothetical protein
MLLVWAGLVIAALMWIVVWTIPARGFFKLREDVRARLVDFAAALTAASETGATPISEAQHAFRDLGAKLSAFAKRRKLAALPLRRMGFDPSSAATGLIGLSNALAANGIERLRWRAQVERALKLEEARMARSRVDFLFILVALAAVTFAAWTYTANWKMRHALRSAHIVRLSLEKEMHAARTGASDAVAGKRAAEKSLSEASAQLTELRRGQIAAEGALAGTTAELALAQKGKVAAEQELEAVMGKLAAAEGALKSSEDRVKALGDELAAAKSAKEEAEKSLKGANDELMQLRSAKAESDAALTKAKDDLEREKKAREAAEQTPHMPPAAPAAAAP